MCGALFQSLARYAVIIPLSTLIYFLKNYLLYVAVFFSVSGVAQADVFTSKNFLAWPEAHQKFWIQGSVDTAALITSHNGNKEQGKCITKWYYGDKRAERNSLIIASMEKYSDVPPNAIMVALIKKACSEL